MGFEQQGQGGQQQLARRLLQQSGSAHFIRHAVRGKGLCQTGALGVGARHDGDVRDPQRALSASLIVHRVVRRAFQAAPHRGGDRDVVLLLVVRPAHPALQASARELPATLRAQRDRPRVQALTREHRLEGATDPVHQLWQ